MLGLNMSGGDRVSDLFHLDHGGKIRKNGEANVQSYEKMQKINT